MKLIQNITLPPPEQRVKQIQGWTLHRAITTYFWVCLLIWGALVLFTAPHGEDFSTGVIATGGISFGIFLASTIAFILGRDNSSLRKILRLNSQLRSLNDVTIAHSVISLISRTKLMEAYDQDSEDAGTYRYEFGMQGPMAAGGVFTIGRLTNLGAYKNYACVTLDMPRSFGHVIIDACKSQDNRDLFKLRHRLPAGYKYDLEGPFVDRFDIYAPDANQMRALTYVLTPDVMQMILDIASTADIEIVDNKIIIVWPEPSFATSMPDWSEVVERAEHIIQGVGSELYARIDTFITHSAAEAAGASKVYIVPTGLGQLIDTAAFQRGLAARFFHSPVTITILSLVLAIVFIVIIAVALGYRAEP